jgi:hypothetical protein
MRLSFSSLAIRSSRQVGFSYAIFRISSRSFLVDAVDLFPPTSISRKLDTQYGAICEMWFCDKQSRGPFEEPGQLNHNNPGSRGRTSRFHSVFLEEGELIAEEQIVGDDGGTGA